jgi:hypothetical protein
VLPSVARVFATLFEMTRLAFILLFTLAAFGAPVDGKWNFVAERTDDHTEALRTVLELKVDGESVSGKLGDTSVKGTFKDGKLSLIFPFTPEGGEERELKIDATLEESVLKGDWVWGGMIAGTFKANKAAD